MKQITVSFTFADEKTVQIITQSLLPELPKDVLQTKVTLTVEDTTLILHIEGSQTSAVRAACNSYFRWIETAYNVTQSI